MCILPSNQNNYYDSIKKYLSSDFPVPSQCVLTRTLTKQGMMMSVTTKIAMQMTCKLGGELWAVEIPVRTVTFSFFMTCPFHVQLETVSHDPNVSVGLDILGAGAGSLIS